MLLRMVWSTMRKKTSERFRKGKRIYAFFEQLDVERLVADEAVPFAKAEQAIENAFVPTSFLA